MKIKTSNLTGAALDWAVAKCEGEIFSPLASSCHYFAPSTNWAQGGPIIEREGIELLCNVTAKEASRYIAGTQADWQAFYRNTRNTEDRSFAATPLVAAMKAFVRRTLGDEVEIPDSLT